jgi:2-pyrone-4,6-dicarboxylate lactonase
MLQGAGLERSLLVQLLAYGEDNAAMLDALDKAPPTLRGIASVTAEVGDAELERLHAAGIRGLRFYFEMPRRIAGVQGQGLGFEHLRALAPRMAALGWVAEISASCNSIVDNAPRLQSLRIPIVLEHMAGCTPAQGTGSLAFRNLIALLHSGTFWVKLTLCRMSDAPPDYEDIRTVHDAFIAAAPERMLWGSDWPHLMMGEDAPAVPHLLDRFDAWIDHDDRLRSAILSNNPAHLFGFPPAAQSGADATTPSAASSAINPINSRPGE